MVDSPSIDTIKELLVLANTPQFLYRHLRASVSGRSHVDPDELFRELRERTESDLSSLDNLARVYQIVAWLLHLSPSKTKVCFDWLLSHGIRWASEFADFASADYVATTYAERDFRQKPVRDVQTVAPTSSTTVLELNA